MSRASSVRRLHLLVLLVLVLSLVAPALPAAALAAAPAAAPVLLSSQPANGNTWDGKPVVFTFDKDMQSAAISVTPALEGKTEVSGATVTFTPAAPPAPNTRYRFTITEATAADGTTLSSPATVNVQTAGPLAVSSTQPSDGAVDTDPAAPVTVIFNRPVAPLTGAEEQAKLPQPLTFAPDVAGKGQWISTSVYQFQPDKPLSGATAYQVTVAALTDVAGEQMEGPYTFGFTTAAPIVLNATPKGIFVDPSSAVQVTFSQPMDPASTASAFSLRDETTGAGPVEGQASWTVTGTTLIFTPTAALTYGDKYTIQVSDKALAASQQGSLREPFNGSFTVVPLPAVAGSSILDGAKGVNPEGELRIRFTAPVSSPTVLANVAVAPLLSTTQVVSYTYSDNYENTNQNAETIAQSIPYGYDTHLFLNWYRQPNTTYTVTIGAGVVDQYGNKLAEPYALKFTTGNYGPLVQIDLDHFTHYSAYTTTVVGVQYRNVPKVDAMLYKLPLDQLYLLAGENQYQVWDNYRIPNASQNLLWAKSIPAEGQPNAINVMGFKLVDKQGKPLPPGVYLFEVRNPLANADNAQSGQPAMQKAVIVLSNHNITIKRATEGESLAWVTDLQSGLPVEGAPLTFTATGAPLAKGATDKDGLVKAALDLPAAQSNTPVFAVSGQPGQPAFAVVSSAWDTGIEPWSFGLNGSSVYDQVNIYLYTDRPIYRPGQTVDWKGIVRVLKGDTWTLPKPGTPVSITVSGGMGATILNAVFRTNEYGTINGAFPLAPDAVTGYYSLNAAMAQPGGTTSNGYASFQVAAYVKPEFEITVKSNQPSYIQGETITVTAQANYFSGSPLVNAPVEWRLVASPYSFSWPGAPAGKWYSFDPFDPNQVDYDPYAGGNMGLVKEGKGVTDADGAFVLTLPADLGESISSQRWSLDVVITSPTNQQVYNNVTFPVHRGQYYIGLSPQSYVFEAGREGKVDAVTITPDFQPYPEAELQAVVYEFQWNNVYAQEADGNYYWKSTAQRTPVFTTTVTTDNKGMGVIAFTPPKAGQYQVTATGQDKLGNHINSAVFVYAAGPGDQYVAWPQQNNDRIQLVTDKKLYQPGDTARILVPNPFLGPVKALVTVERAGVIEAKVVELAGSSQTVEIPVTAAEIPNVFVGVVLVKGMDKTNPYAATRVGYAQIPVDTAEKQLTLDVKPSANKLLPGAMVTYTITVKDSTGRPVPNAETSMALVDKAVLTLGKDFMDTRSLLDIFYYQRGLGVTTGSLIVINKDRVSQQLAKGGKGGGGGGGGGGPEVREEFPDTAYWRADLVSDDKGVIQFSVQLPDNLTTWVLTAKAVTKDTLVGEAVNEIVATKDLQVRPMLPRFFTAGDRAIIGGVVLNTTSQPLENGQFIIAVSGATLDSGQATQTFTAQPNAPVTFEFPISVDQKAPSVVVTMTAQAGDLADGVRMTVPVERYQSPETVATSGVVPTAGTTEAVYVPKTATDDGELSLVLDPSLGAGLIDGLTYLQHYPYECTEQTVSRFLPNLFTVRALRDLKLSNPALESQLAYQLGIGVQRLITGQNPDGGWGYWPQEESSPFISAYVLWGLWNADALGYTVDQNVLDRGATYLDSQFQAPADITDANVLDTMAFMHYVLAQMGRGDAGRMSTLYDVRERLDSYGQAFLAMALHSMNPQDPRVTTLMDGLAGSAVVTATGAWWVDTRPDFANMSTDVRSTAIILDAFLQIRPDDALLPNVVRWLMTMRRDGRWATTQENAWSIIALTDWLASTGELNADFGWKAVLNDQEWGSGQFQDPFSQATLRKAVADLLRDQANLLQISRTDGPGVLYYSAYLKYYVDALAVQPANQGVIVDRQFLSTSGQPVSSMKVGDVVSVTVTIVAPTDLYHVHIQAPIPAGTEALNPSLPTGFQYDQQGQPVLKPVDASAGGWYNWMPAQVDYRDDGVNLFATFLPAGTYQYTFQVRAALAGEYRVLPATGEMMYFPEVWGRSGGQLMTIGR